MAKDLSEPTIGYIVTPVTWDGADFHPLLSTVAGLLKVSIETACAILTHMQGHDGAGWVNVHVDAAGDIQADVLSIADGEIRTYGWDGAAWQKVSVDGSGHVQADILSIVEGQVKGYLWDGSAWQKVKGLASGVAQVDIDSLRGKNTIIAEHIKEPYIENASGNLVAVNGFLDGTAVPAGEIWKVTTVTFWNQVRNDTFDRLQIMGPGAGLVVERNNTPATAVPYVFQCELYMAAGQYLRCFYWGGQIGDACKLQCFGKKMLIP